MRPRSGILHSGPVEQSRCDIGEGDERLVHKTSRAAGTSHDKGSADARFILCPHRSGFRSAVIGDQKDEGVLIMTMLFQRLKGEADSMIGTRDLLIVSCLLYTSDAADERSSVDLVRDMTEDDLIPALDRRLI